jgi:hypothetical protein
MSIGSPLVMICGHIDDQDIVAAEERSLGDGAKKFAEELPEPDALRNDIGTPCSQPRR